MTDTPPENKPDEGSGIKKGDLIKLIQDTVAEIVKGDSSDKKDDDAKDSSGGSGGSIADRVREEIEAIRSREKDEEEKKSLREQVSKLAEATKEKPPVERRRVHKLMGWGENAD